MGRVADRVRPRGPAGAALTWVPAQRGWSAPARWRKSSRAGGGRSDLLRAAGPKHTLGNSPRTSTAPAPSRGAGIRKRGRGACARRSNAGGRAAELFGAAAATREHRADAEDRERARSHRATDVIGAGAPRAGGGGARSSALDRRPRLFATPGAFGCVPPWRLNLYIDRCLIRGHQGRGAGDPRPQGANPAVEPREAQLF